MIFTIPQFQPIINEPIAIVQKIEEAKPEPKLYTIQPGDTLESIAKANLTTSQRLFNKNTNIDNPDLIKPGEVLTIPLDDEVLSERVAIEKQSPVSARSQGSFNSGGNTYQRGQCTWYAKSRRPDLPNNLGNSISWVVNAARQGIPTGSVPRAGAIGQQGMHVVYIEAVNADGTVYLSEMNYDYHGGFRYRTAPASDFMYIY